MTFVIAEAGVNHDGNLGDAIKLINVAAVAGADAVKFQAFTPEKLAEHDYGRRAMLRGLALTLPELAHLARVCEEVKIEFMCTAFDAQWLEALIVLGIKRIKIASGQTAPTQPNIRMWEVAKASGLPVIISNGARVEKFIDDALRALGPGSRTILYCVSDYPTKQEALLLPMIRHMQDRWPQNDIGFSSHCPNLWASVTAARVYGATVIENHITLDRDRSGPDHTSSLLPGELGVMVRELRP